MSTDPHKLGHDLQSLRVAYDVIEGRRSMPHPSEMWWFDPVRNLDRIEAERAKQAAQQSDRDALVP